MLLLEIYLEIMCNIRGVISLGHIYTELIYQFFNVYNVQLLHKYILFHVTN